MNVLIVCYFVLCIFLDLEVVVVILVKIFLCDNIEEDVYFIIREYEGILYFYVYNKFS